MRRGNSWIVSLTIGGRRLVLCVVGGRGWLLMFRKCGNRRSLDHQTGKQNKYERYIYSLAIIVKISDLQLFSGILFKVLTSSL